MFEKKKVLVAVCGSVSAYISVEVVDYLKKNGADVHVLMTETATKFIRPLTFQTVSGNPVAVDNYALGNEWNIPHIDVTTGADYLFVLPATATTMAKVACGFADNVVTAAVLSAACPVYFAPTMNVRMYAKSVTEENMRKLEHMGYKIIEPAEGQMICGAVGPGKMQTATYLCHYLEDVIKRSDGTK